MPPTDTSAQAETTPDAAQAAQLQQPDDAEQARAFVPESALDPRLRADIQKAWNASVDEVGELEPEVEASKLAPQAAKPKPAPAKPAAEPEPETEAEAADAEAVEKLEAKAEKRKLTQAENRELMQARIAQNQRFQRREQAQAQRFAQREQQLQQLEAQHRSTHEPLMNAIKALEAGDFDGFAKHAGAYLKDPKLTDWSALNSFALENVQSPVYKRMRQVERELEERTQQERVQQEQQRAQQQVQAQQSAIADWKANLHDECVSDDDPAVAALVEARPAVVDALFAIQQQHFHSNAGDELSAHDAAVQFMRNVRSDFEFWNSFFETHSESELLSGIQAAAPKPVKHANRGATLERQTAKKTSGAAQQVQAPAAARPGKLPSKTISQTQTAGASALKPMTDAELMKHFAPLIQQELR